MRGAATLAAAALAVTLLWASMAKLAHPQSTRETFAALHLPTPLAVVVPVTELMVAAALVVRPATGGIAALVLLAAFTLVTIRAVRAQLSCGCFGTAAAGPTTGVDVLRNGMLAALAVLATGAPRPASPNIVSVAVVLGACAAGAGVLTLLRARSEERP
jgi:hypothetical protein